jgi:hypothetical protein
MERKTIEKDGLPNGNEVKKYYPKEPVFARAIVWTGDNLELIKESFNRIEFNLKPNNSLGFYCDVGKEVYTAVVGEIIIENEFGELEVFSKPEYMLDSYLSDIPTEKTIPVSKVEELIEKKTDELIPAALQLAENLKDWRTKKCQDLSDRVRKLNTEIYLLQSLLQ